MPLPRTANDLYISSWSPPPGQHCEYGAREPLPALDAVFDSSSVSSLLRTLPPGAVIVSVFVAPDHVIDTIAMPVFAGQPRANVDSVMIVEATLADTLLTALRRNLLNRVRPRVDATFLLRIDLGPSIQFRLAPSVFCDPVVRDDHAYRAALALLRPVQSAHEAKLQLLVTSDGLVPAAAVTHSTGDPALDRALLAAARKLVYYPTLLNRRPSTIAIQVTVPVIQR